MSRQRKGGNQAQASSTNEQHRPHTSGPLNFLKAVPTTILGTIFSIIRKTFILIYGLSGIFPLLFIVFVRNPVYDKLYGPYWWLTEEEREELFRSRAEIDARKPPLKSSDLTLLGFVRGTHQLRWQPNSSSVIFCGQFTCDDPDPFTHYVTAYNQLGPSVADKRCRLIKYTGQSEPLEVDRFYGVQTYPTLEYAPNGSIQSFILATSSFPLLMHPAIPVSEAQSALPWHWLLNLASAISFMHSRGVAHCALSLEAVWLRADFSAALFDLSCTQFNAFDEEHDRITTFHGDGVMTGCFLFPSGQLSLDHGDAWHLESMLVGKANDVFDFGTVMWRLLTRTLLRAPPWEIPHRENCYVQWGFPELRQQLREAVSIGMGKSKYEPPGMEVVRKCWTLEYKEGEEILEDLRKTVVAMGLKVQGSDEIEGVAQAMEEFKKDYRPRDYLGKEVFDRPEHG